MNFKIFISPKLDDGIDQMPLIIFVDPEGEKTPPKNLPAYIII